MDWYKGAEIVFGLLLVGWLYWLTIRQQHIADRADAILGALERVLAELPSKSAPRTEALPLDTKPAVYFQRLRHDLPPVPPLIVTELGPPTDVMRVVGRHRSEEG